MYLLLVGYDVKAYKIKPGLYHVEIDLRQV